MAFQRPDLNGEVFRRRNHLPHWELLGATYFVTFRLADSVPQEKLTSWEDARDKWMEANKVSELGGIDQLSDTQRAEYHRSFTSRFHDWLDAGHGACVLRSPVCGSVVSGALRHFDGERYALEAYVVMANHVHVLVTPDEGIALADILHSWKSFTAHEVNRILGSRGVMWQKESYDHIVRSESQFEHYRQYVRDNPVKAKLRQGEFIYWDALGEPT